MVKKIILIILASIFGLIIVLGITYFSLLKKSSNPGTVDFSIKPGEGTKVIAKNLAKERIIPSYWVFVLHTKLMNRPLQAGVYRFEGKKNTIEAYDFLTSGKAKVLYITIPEGWSVSQIDQLLADRKLVKKGEFAEIAKGDEGYLFPDTYHFLPDQTKEEVRQAMLDNFKEKTSSMQLTKENVILASIVEREAKLDEDRPKIAEVYLNRLAKNMKLEADPTVQYAKGSWDQIRSSDYHSVDSPYNTYIHEGLPPGPICNPGLKSLEAVLYPDKNDYYFFFHKDDGHAVYSKTFEEHQENLRMY